LGISVLQYSGRSGPALPLETEQHAVSWSDFEAAGVSRDMIREAIDEAIKHHFIRCIRQPQAKKTGRPSVSGLYELKWDERPAYVKDPKEFRGFFAGEGNRTYIPNQFFDDVIPREPLAVVKVVGSVIRFSIGFQNKWGHRRRNASLSYPSRSRSCRPMAIEKSSPMPRSTLS